MKCFISQSDSEIHIFSYAVHGKRKYHRSCNVVPYKFDPPLVPYV